MGQQLALGAPIGQLGRYELLSLIAKGGMGEVFLGRVRGMAGFQKLVVIKRNIPSDDDERRSQMLFAEARLAASLQHANIVQVLDVGREQGTVFIAMEFLHGHDLRTIAKHDGGKLPIETAVAVMLAACAGLHYAHEQRDEHGLPLEIVHRDVSPSNVFVTYDGLIKLIDFGIAKATTLPSETQLGTIKGKPGYMSPEQCEGEPLDRRSDVFNLGIMLYELTLGRAPFRAETEYLTCRKIVEHDPPAPTTIDPAYPPALEAIVMRALRKDRRDRYATALEMQEELAAFARASSLDVSQWRLISFMSSRFAAELAAWHEAKQGGESLEDYVVRRASQTVRALPPQMLATRRERPTPVEARPRGRRWLVAGTLGVAAAVAITLTIWMRDDQPAAAPAMTNVQPPIVPAPQNAPVTVAPAAAPVPEPPPPTDPAPLATPESTRKAVARERKRPPPRAKEPGPDDAW